LRRYASSAGPARSVVHVQRPHRRAALQHRVAQARVAWLRPRTPAGFHLYVNMCLIAWLPDPFTCATDLPSPVEAALAWASAVAGQGGGGRRGLERVLEVNFSGQVGSMRLGSWRAGRHIRAREGGRKCCARAQCTRECVEAHASKRSALVLTRRPLLCAVCSVVAAGHQ
jgi:hypothetical protein